MRQGFTLVETLVALLLFQVGMLAIAATGAIAAREIATARRAALARDVARNRIEALRPAACAGAAGSEGSAAGAPGVTEHWRVVASGSARQIDDSVSYRLPRGRTAFVVIHGGMLCP